VKFLLEIGVEEVPDWMLPDAVAHLRAKVEELLPKVTLAEATPRRLAIVADRVAEREADRTEVVKGPPLAAPPEAVEGFARKQGVDPSALEKTENYYQYTKRIPGRATREILAEKLPGVILGIPWPKTMLWPGKGGARFIRPIRWIVCLLGKEIVPFTVNGVASGDTTRGHRQLGKKKPIRVSITSYEKTLEKNGVILRAAKRREKLLAEVGEDTPLIDAHVYLNEWPTALRGSFDPSYLALPREVLDTVMRVHQKFFPLRDQPGFIAVMNRKDDPEGLIRAGNERVLRARFNDARFFYDVDQKKKLADRVEDLKRVTFHKDIGSYYDKTMRIVELCDDETSKRAALLSKCDLTTEMVKEFPELQGIIGGRYAEAQGEPPEVAKAIYEQYVYDRPPSTRAGQMLALADRLDTLREMFRIGQIPSGSKDPFALRRAALGVVRILAEGQVRRLPFEPAAELREFLLERVRYYFRDVRGFAYDEVNAVLAAGWDDLQDVHARLEAVRAVRKTENFEPLAASFKRIKNILKQAGFSPAAPVQEDLLENGPERNLYTAIRAVQLTGRYQEDLAAIASLRPAVDAFFDKVLVNAPDAAVRQNRLTLLFSLMREFSQVADFSEIVPNQ
jgi:glycyl-tRNA synthetase beta chain